MRLPPQSWRCCRPLTEPDPEPWLGGVVVTVRVCTHAVHHRTLPLTCKAPPPTDLADTVVAGGVAAVLSVFVLMLAAALLASMPLLPGYSELLQT